MTARPVISLEDIGFYTMTDARCRSANATTPLQRGEILLTGRCNFKCPYCRSIGGLDLPFEKALMTVRQLADEGLQNIRFSGGEPTMYAGLEELVSYAKELGVKRIAVSSNGSRIWPIYQGLIDAGVNDFSISLDACCAEDGDKMAGGVSGAWDAVVATIKRLSPLVYTTVGVVLTEANQGSIEDIIRFADSLGVADIRIIPAAQDGDKLNNVQVSKDLLNKYPILAYRIRNIQRSLPVRGLRDGDSSRCSLVLDDVAILDGKHYPCIIYLRESGAAIGELTEGFRADREAWAKNHDTKADPICSKNCLDVCVEYNTRYEGFRA